MVASRAGTLQDDLDTVIAEFNKFCLAIDNEFGMLINKLSNVKITMEAVFFNGMQKKKSKTDQPLDADGTVGETTAFAKVHKANMHQKI